MFLFTVLSILTLKTVSVNLSYIVHIFRAWGGGGSYMAPGSATRCHNIMINGIIINLFLISRVV
jgi:hypothetical protein